MAIIVPNYYNGKCEQENRGGGISRLILADCRVCFTDIFNLNEWEAYVKAGLITMTGEIMGSLPKGEAHTYKSSACNTEKVMGYTFNLEFSDYNAGDKNSDFDYWSSVIHDNNRYQIGFTTCDGLFYGFIKQYKADVGLTIEEDASDSTFWSGNISWKSWQMIKPINLDVASIIDRFSYIDTTNTTLQCCPLTITQPSGMNMETITSPELSYKIPFFVQRIQQGITSCRMYDMVKISLRYNGNDITPLTLDTTLPNGTAANLTEKYVNISFKRSDIPNAPATGNINISSHIEWKCTGDDAISKADGPTFTLGDGITIIPCCDMETRITNNILTALNNKYAIEIGFKQLGINCEKYDQVEVLYQITSPVTGSEIQIPNNLLSYVGTPLGQVLNPADIESNERFYLATLDRNDLLTQIGFTETPTDKFDQDIQIRVIERYKCRSIATKPTNYKPVTLKSIWNCCPVQFIGNTTNVSYSDDATNYYLSFLMQRTGVNCLPLDTLKFTLKIRQKTPSVVWINNPNPIAGESADIWGVIYTNSALPDNTIPSTVVQFDPILKSVVTISNIDPRFGIDFVIEGKYKCEGKLEDTVRAKDDNLPELVVSNIDTKNKCCDLTLASADSIYVQYNLKEALASNVIVDQLNPLGVQCGNYDNSIFNWKCTIATSIAGPYVDYGIPVYPSGNLNGSGTWYQAVLLRILKEDVLAKVGTGSVFVKWELEYACIGGLPGKTEIISSYAEVCCPVISKSTGYTKDDFGNRWRVIGTWNRDLSGSNSCKRLESVYVYYTLQEEISPGVWQDVPGWIDTVMPAQYLYTTTGYSGSDPNVGRVSWNPDFRTEITIPWDVLENPHKNHQLVWYSVYKCVGEPDQKSALAPVFLNGIDCDTSCPITLQNPNITYLNLSLPSLGITNAIEERIEWDVVFPNVNNNNCRWKSINYYLVVDESFVSVDTDALNLPNLLLWTDTVQMTSGMTQTKDSDTTHFNRWELNTWFSNVSNVFGLLYGRIVAEVNCYGTTASSYIIQGPVFELPPIACCPIITTGSTPIIENSGFYNWKISLNRNRFASDPPCRQVTVINWEVVVRYIDNSNIPQINTSLNDNPVLNKASIAALYLNPLFSLAAPIDATLSINKASLFPMNIKNNSFVAVDVYMGHNCDGVAPTMVLLDTHTFTFTI